MTSTLINCRDCQAVDVLDPLNARRLAGIHQGKTGHVVALAEVENQ